MTLKATCVWLSLLTATGISAVPDTVVAKAAALAVHESLAGGQAPPPAAGGSGGFAVQVGSGLDQTAADGLKRDLINEGFTSAETRPGAQGKFDVVLPNIATDAQAKDIVTQLKGSGYTTDVKIIGASGAAAGSSSEAAAPAGGTIYRVKVAEFGTAEQATEASKALIDEGFVNVDVTEENGKQVLMLGTFNQESDAKALLGDVNRAGFALASVVAKERIQGESQAGKADLSGLPAEQQATMRNVLTMADKVASGATAEEAKQLQEMIQRLDANQKAILSQQESGRTQDSTRRQKIYQHYRDFYAAISTKNYDKAAQSLAEVRKLDPNELRLPEREQLLNNERSGIASSAPAVGTPAAGRPDPAQVQTLLNEARAAASSGNNAQALQKYNQILALDPTHVEARTKTAELSSSGAPAETADASGGGLMENKPLVYGAAGALAFIILLFLWMRSRKSKAPATSTPAAGTAFGGSTDFVDPLGNTGFSTPSPAIPAPSPSVTPAGGIATGMAGGLAGGLAGAGMADMQGYHSINTGDEEEEAPRPITKPAPAPVVEESDTVSLDDFAPGAAPAQDIAPAESAPVEDEVVSINFDEEFNSQPQSPVTTPTPPAASATPARGASSMDADLEALLKGTFGGGPEPVAEEPAIPNIGAEAIAAAGSAAAARVVLNQAFDSETSGAVPADWRGEYDYATLAVEELGEPGHQRSLKFEKMEGAGSATYHLTFPPVKGQVTAEFDLRCDQKNKFLLGVYLERDEDFKQSIHTIVHQLDPNAPASLRIQGEGAPYQMGTWVHMKYEIDLDNGTLNGYMDGEHVVKNSQLAVIPEYLNTLSIRDNLATTGTLYLDNIQISEA